MIKKRIVTIAILASGAGIAGIVYLLNKKKTSKNAEVSIEEQQDIVIDTETDAECSNVITEASYDENDIREVTDIVVNDIVNTVKSLEFEFQPNLDEQSSTVSFNETDDTPESLPNTNMEE